MINRLLLVVFLIVSGSYALAEPMPDLLVASDLADFDSPPADARIHYGDGPLQFGDLRIPSGAGPHPVAVFIHGGCWLSEYDIMHTGKLAAALADNGIATWSLEYRRVGDKGGGWPGTFRDVGRGADHLGALAEEYALDLDRVIAMGHSAGGHLALWLAARSGLPHDATIAAADPLQLHGVLALAPAPDLRYLHEKEVCGHVIDKLMGGSPQQVPDRYRWGDPTLAAPADVPQVLVIGKHDANWAPPGLRYFQAAKERGDNVRVIDATESGHFEMIDPDSSTWPLVLEAARNLLGGAGD